MTDTEYRNALESGALVQEYRLVRVLGAGSFGIVYLAENIYLPETVAIKEFLPNELAHRVDGSTVVPVSSDADEAYRWALGRFIKEAQILWELGRPAPHRSIVRVLRLMQANGTAYMVLEFEEGLSLSKKLETEGKMAQAELEAMLFDLLDGLELVHSKSVWHRDIKPDNILIRPDGSPVLIDFGAARWDAGERTRSMLTVFTPNYAPPEQVLHSGELGPWTDIYSLAATLYRVVMRNPPLPATERTLGTMHKLATTATDRGYSARFLRAIDAGLALSPIERRRASPSGANCFGPTTARHPAPRPKPP